MRSIPNRDTCALFGFSNGQLRHSRDDLLRVWTNKEWSLDDGETSFGFGDLDTDDLNRVLDWCQHPSHEEDVVFTAWSEHHDATRKPNAKPTIRIDKDGITFPHQQEVLKLARKANA